MRTYLECIPCFFKQAINTSKLAGASQKTQKEIVNELARLIPNFPFNSTPPEMARLLHKIIERKTKKSDPFREIKKKSNKLALGIYPEMKKRVRKSKDKLLTATEIAIAGNIIDYGVKSSLNIEKEIDKLFKQDFRKADKKILYIGDNTGEIVFDRILVEELSRLGKEVIFAVRSKPAINDALMEDAIDCGIDKTATVIRSGSDAPGTILKYCTKSFRKLFKSAELIISKGQGNYETLTESTRPIYFLFKAKCPIIAKHVGAKLGSTILKKM